MAIRRTEVNDARSESATEQQQGWRGPVPFDLPGATDTGKAVSGSTLPATEPDHGPPGFDRINQQGMARLFNALPALVVLADEKGRTLFVNDATTSYTGLSRAELAPWGLGASFPVEALDRALERVGKAVSAIVPFEQLQQVRRADGVLRWHLIRQMPVAGDHGGIAYLASNAVDVDDMVHELDTLRAENTAKDEMLGLVAHELRSPLTTILASARRLAVPGRVAEDEIETVEFLLEDTVRLKTLIDNMLVLAQGTHEPELEPVLLQRLLPGVIAIHRSRFRERVLNLDMERDLSVVSAHPGWTEQVLENFLSNAEKYTPAGTPITVKVCSAGDHVEVRVLDRGPGFPLEHAEHLFVAFHREDATRESAPGIGLGLAVCKRLIDLQGGRIWAALRPEGGAEFGFSVPTAFHETSFLGDLPVARASIPLNLGETAVAEMPRGNETILVVDDDPTVRELTKRVLQRCGYTVLEAANGSQALQVADSLGETAIHLMITDVMMPALSGPELAQRLAVQRPRLRVLFFSGYTADEFIHHQVGTNGTAFLQKPFQLADLTQRVRLMLDGAA